MVQGGSGLDALYKLCVCNNAVDFGPCAAENVVCGHGAGLLCHGHLRNLLPEEMDKKEVRRS